MAAITYLTLITGITLAAKVFKRMMATPKSVTESAL